MDPPATLITSSGSTSSVEVIVRLSAAALGRVGGEVGRTAAAGAPSGEPVAVAGTASFSPRQSTNWSSSFLETSLIIPLPN
jgi:hypothetical protein